MAGVMREPRIAFGHVVHQRLRPVRHAFRYPVFFLRVPLSRIAALERRWLSVDRWNLLSFMRRDFGPRDGNHSCDMTAVDLDIKSADGKQWNLAREVSPNILAGNPHADMLGNPGVWHFYSEPDTGGGADSIVPAGSLLAKWRAAADAAEKARSEDAAASAAFRTVASKLLPDLFPDQ